MRPFPQLTMLNRAFLPLCGHFCRDPRIPLEPAALPLERRLPADARHMLPAMPRTNSLGASRACQRQRTCAGMEVTTTSST